MMEYTPEIHKSVCKRLEHTGQRPPSSKVCNDQIKYAFAILNRFLNDLTEDKKTVLLYIKQILLIIQPYIENKNTVGIDKYIIRICSVFQSTDLLFLVKNTENPEIKLGILVLKFAISGEYSSEIGNLLRMVPDDLRMKAQAQILLRRCETDEDIEPLMFYMGRTWNDFRKYEKNEKFSFILECFKLSKLEDAMAVLQAMKSSENKTFILHVYNFLSLIHLFRLEYQEAIYYLDMALELATGVEQRHFLNAKFLLERFACVPAPYPCMGVSVYIDECRLYSHKPGNRNVKKIVIENSGDIRFYRGCDELCAKEIFENKFLLQLCICNGPYRQVLSFKKFVSEPDFNASVQKTLKTYSEYAIVLLYEYRDRLYLCNLNKEKGAQNIGVDWKALKMEMEEILEKSRRVLKKKVEGDSDRREWWMKRIELNREIEDLLERVRDEIGAKIETPAKKQVILVVGSEIANFPFEMLFQRPVCRILSLEYLFEKENTAVDSSSVFYLLDPGNSLPSTQKRIEPFMKFLSLSGVVGRRLCEPEIAILEASDLFLYFGHGTGQKYFAVRSCNPQSLLLFGCSSCRLIHRTNFKPNGVLLDRFTGSRSILGMLWDVTDKDLDILTIAVLKAYFNGTDLSVALFESRRCCKLKYLNGAAAVIYGVP